MKSLKDIAIRKTAVTVCFYPEVKREILCARGSEFDVTKSRDIYCRKEQWNEIIEKKAREVCTRQGLPKVLQDAVMNFLPAIGLKMLIWAEYHEGTVGFTRDYSVTFLCYSHITREGVVDSVKAAKDLIEYGNLSVRKKYKLACMYCFKGNIGSLYNKCVKAYGKDAISEASNSKWFQRPEIVKFWTRQLTRMREKLPDQHSLRARRLQHAIRSGSIAAVIFSWSAMRYSSQKKILLEAVKEILISERSTQDDWIIFRDERFDDDEEAWVPTDYSDDILRFIFEKMLRLQEQGELQINFLDSILRQCVHLVHHRSLELFLSWPHQEYFMRTATVMWDYISKHTYVTLLMKICDKIEPQMYKNLQYGEEKCYEYKCILKKFWRESPDRFKRHVFQNDCVFQRVFERTTAARYLLFKLFSYKKFTRQDEEIVRSILDSATDGEREYLLLATCWKNSIVTWMQVERFDAFDRFLRACFGSEFEADMFKENLKLHEEARDICRTFVKYKKLNAIQSFLSRIPITESQLECLKVDLIYSSVGKLKCLEILSDDGNKAFEKFLRWFLPTEESALAFKKEFTFEHRCDFPHSAESWCHEEFGLQMCVELICSHSLQVVSNAEYSSLHAKSHFRGGQWKKLNQFLSLLPATKVLIFKDMVFRKAGVRILTRLIKAKQWAQTERLFKWLELSKAEIRELKWDSLTDSEGTLELFDDLVFSECDDKANHLERVYAMLKWHLTDIVDVLDFRRFFLLRVTRYFNEDGLHIFTSVVDMYVDELNKRRFEKLNAHARKANRTDITQNSVKGVKKQSRASAPSKKARLSQPGLKKKQTKKTVVVKKRQSQRLLDKSNENNRTDITQNSVKGVKRQSRASAPSKKARLSQPGLKEEQTKKTVVVKRRQSRRLLDKSNKK